jgi:hypothetical protein
MTIRKARPTRDFAIMRDRNTRSECHSLEKLFVNSKNALDERLSVLLPVTRTQCQKR